MAKGHFLAPKPNLYWSDTSVCTCKIVHAKEDFKYLILNESRVSPIENLYLCNTVIKTNLLHPNTDCGIKNFCLFWILFIFKVLKLLLLFIYTYNLSKPVAMKIFFACVIFAIFGDKIVFTKLQRHLFPEGQSDLLTW